LAGVLQDLGEEIFDSEVVGKRVHLHSNDVVHAGEFPIDAGAEILGAGFDGVTDGSVVGIGEEWVIAGLNDHQGAGDFGDGVDGADRVKIGTGNPFCEAISIILKKWAGSSQAVGMESGGGVEVGEGAFEDDGPKIVAQDSSGGGGGSAEADAEEEDLAGF